ncbi:SARP family transcriptional regulator [Virgisporangium aliadipatigenens]|uniref:SARP family transcriptional regulator n=1 Tax=Virgisporangium aliadipatigenens TaxID=741659 RepID=A0A8J3YKZ8_9ACTN|nr:tetratricopeptide repeat protein [Virgisporangium aliadipatigenens]GIJ46237.1 SARP family transcriptional regulator [Virgisporangium aliadipatigenens]
MAEVRLLGAVQLRSKDGPLDLGPPKQRAVFAALVVDAGRPVAVDTLVARVWDDPPPAEARNALYAHIMRIRRLLARVAEADGVALRLDRRPGGYVFDIDRDRVDLHRFHRLVERARDRGHDDGRRAELLREALELWRGAPVADLPGPWFARLRETWRQHRVDAVIAWARAETRLGNHEAVVGRLRDVAVDHPLVEPLAAATMRALHAAGRGAEALEHYAAVRQRLVDQLGTDPGPELQRAHQAILRGDSRPEAGPDTARRPDGRVPRQLPAPPQMFTGRTRELAELERLHDASTVVISAIDGMAGVGKSALAVHAGHRLAGRYPDGQLFIDLHGHTPGTAPREPGEALDQLLRALGVPGTQIPSGVAERAGLYRTRLADRRMLVLLDNAATEAQVAPLLPGAPGCLVLITSRHRLAGLDRTGTLSLDTLPTSDGVALFTRSVGTDRLADEPSELLAELVELCGRLPLAIRIAAARLRSHRTWDVSHLVARLRDRQHRLGELEAGQRSVTAALDLSYRHLAPPQRHAYRLLGLHPGVDIDPHAVAALLGSTVADAGRTLDRLLEAHLLQEPVPGRYRFHDLTRAHAAHTAADGPAPPAADAALTRLLDHYRHTALLAMDVAYPSEREYRPRLPPADPPGSRLTTPAAAWEWLDAELPNLLAAATYAHAHDRPEHVLHLSAILHRHLRTRGRYRDAETLHHQALTAARGTGRPADELAALNGLGHIYRQQGRYAEAADHFGRALRTGRETGHRAAELAALNGLGQIYRRQGRYDEAGDHCRQALEIARAIGDRPGELDALNGLARVHWVQGRYAEAADHFGRALRIARATGNRPGELDALNGLGQIHRVQGRHAEAATYFQQALPAARVTGNQVGELTALTGLGHIYGRQGRQEQAAAHYRQLLALARRNDDRNFEFEARQGLGRLRHAAGDSDGAIAHHRRALALAGELGQPADQARAHDGLAHAYHSLDQPVRAREHWRVALDVLTGLGLHRTDDEETTIAAIRVHLGALDRPGTPNG